jgi:hydrogenase maturation protein HypF
MCPECLADILDPQNRRYRYPFTNCTNCGPRYSIIEALPYDRGNTTMRIFEMCDECRSEYENPADRRFHAQPTSCTKCGPHLEVWDSDGCQLESHEAALETAAEALRVGRIIALKGLGGFQLLVDAQNEDAVVRLRRKKHRARKPFALMFPGLGSAGIYCDMSEAEAKVLHSPQSPIVIITRRVGCERLAPSVALGGANLGVMLPYTPLHHLLMGMLNRPANHSASMSVKLSNGSEA